MGDYENIEWKIENSESNIKYKIENSGSDIGYKIKNSKDEIMSTLDNIKFGLIFGAWLFCLGSFFYNDIRGTAIMNKHEELHMQTITEVKKYIETSNEETSSKIDYLEQKIDGLESSCRYK